MCTAVDTLYNYIVDMCLNMLVLKTVVIIDHGHALVVVTINSIYIYVINKRQPTNYIRIINWCYFLKSSYFGI